MQRECQRENRDYSSAVRLTKSEHETLQRKAIENDSSVSREIRLLLKKHLFKQAGNGNE